MKKHDCLQDSRIARIEERLGFRKEVNDELRLENQKLENRLSSIEARTNQMLFVLVITFITAIMNFVLKVI